MSSMVSDWKVRVDFLCSEGWWHEYLHTRAFDNYTLSAEGDVVRHLCEQRWGPGKLEVIADKHYHYTPETVRPCVDSYFDPGSGKPRWQMKAEQQPADGTVNFREFL